MRGRSGCQGDPGQSKFFLSLEDDPHENFASSKISKVMDTLGMEDDEPIEHKMVTNAIAKAQKKVEGHNFEIRKHLLEYDNVMNDQRRVIYKLRRDILGDNDNMGFVKEMIEDVALFLVDTYRPEKKVPLDQWPWDDIVNSFQTTFNSKETLDMEECYQKHDGELSAYIHDKAKGLLDQKFSSYEEEQVKMALREILLSIFDQFWKDHLLSMDHIKEGVNLRAYAQKDPLTEYKRDSFNLFETMRSDVKKSIVENIFTVQLYTQEEMEELKKQQQAQLEAQLEAHKAEQKAQEETPREKTTCQAKE